MKLNIRLIVLIIAYAVLLHYVFPIALLIAMYGLSKSQNYGRTFRFVIFVWVLLLFLIAPLLRMGR